eukprot:jgi/Botrbrau1/3118/Bobra.0070s0092.1
MHMQAIRNLGFEGLFFHIPCEEFSDSIEFRTCSLLGRRFSRIMLSKVATAQELICTDAHACLHRCMSSMNMHFLTCALVAVKPVYILTFEVKSYFQFFLY